MTDLFKTDVTMLLVNIQSLLKNSAELQATVRLMHQKPDIIFLNETWLDRSIAEIPLEGYVCVARTDRRNGQKCGGVATYARDAIAPHTAMAHESAVAERHWVILHSNQGPFLLANWYRPPCAGETASIQSLKTEWDALKGLAMGTVIAGDLNVHHTSWLRFSQRESVEGRELHDIAQDCGFNQLVRKPTREDNLLDLVLSDMDAKCEVLPKIADHQAVAIRLALSVPEVKQQHRFVWHFKKADWDGLKDKLSEMDWEFLDSWPVDAGAELFQSKLLELAEEHIPRKRQTVMARSHEWLTDRVVRLVKDKKDAEGTEYELNAAAACSQAITEEFAKYVAKSKEELLQLPRGSKCWWRKARALALKGRGVSGIPSLQDGSKWCHAAEEKAELFAKTFSAKCAVPRLEVNEYSDVAQVILEEARFGGVSEEVAVQVLKELKPDSATGPDLLPARILKECASELGKPLSRLVQQIVNTGSWPDLWRAHWIVPIHKRKAMTNTKNYRGCTSLHKSRKRQSGWSEYWPLRSYSPPLDRGQPVRLLQGKGCQGCSGVPGADVHPGLRAQAEGYPVLLRCARGFRQGARGAVRVQDQESRASCSTGTSVLVLDEEEKSERRHGWCAVQRHGAQGHGVPRHGLGAIPLERVLRRLADRRTQGRFQGYRVRR